MERTGTDRGIYLPAEWHRHKKVWLAWPYSQEFWRGLLTQAQTEFSKFASTLAQHVPVSLITPDETIAAQALRQCDSSQVSTIQMPYGDIWLRDTGPIFLHNNLQTEARCFEFNGWGGKYLMPFDDQVSREIAVRSGVPFEEIPIIFEGGSIDCNGNGVVLTTEECLLNANRNPTMSRRDIEKSLDSSLGIENILWLKRGLKFDHTDGHIDNCARFINETKIVAMKSVEKDDPQRERLREIADQLEVFATQMGLNVITIPSPGLVVDPFGDVMPASYLNFLISNDVVLVPIFNVASDETALSMLQEHFPNHKVLGLPSYYILTGGGSFHCISQQEPAQ